MMKNKRTVNRYVFLVVSVFSLVSFLDCPKVWSAPAYGTKMPANGKVFGGLQTYQILDRELEGGSSFESAQYFALLSYGVFDWLSLDLKGGIGNADWQAENFSNASFSTFLAGGYGFRVRLYENQEQNTKFVFGFQHISDHPYSIDRDNDSRGEHFKVVVDDWQFSLLGSYQIQPVTVYAGGRWDRMDLITWVDSERNRIKPEDRWGAIAGFDWNINERFGLMWKEIL